MKILLLTTHLNIGGVGVYTVSLAKHIKRMGHDVSVASGGGDMEGVLKSLYIEHIKLDIHTKSEFGIKVWKSMPLLIRLLRSRGFQVIHAQTRVAQVLAYFAQKYSGVPFVSTCHGFFKHRRLSRRLLPCWGEKVIAISKSVAEHLSRDFNVEKERIVQIYNGIELGKFSEMPEEKNQEYMRDLGLGENDFVIGSVGRLSSVKGFKYLVSAFREVSTECPQAKLLLVGEGPEEAALRAQAEEFNMTEKIVFTPGNGSLIEYLYLMDIFCLPSVNEGLGLSLMEAMAACRCCVASNVGGLRELISDGRNGLLVRSESPRELSEALIRLIKDESFRDALAEKAREKALVEFAIEDSVAKTVEVYESVVNRRETV